MSRDTFAEFITKCGSKTIGRSFVDAGEPDRLFGRAPNPTRGWALFCGYDERGFAVIIQKAVNDRAIMVSVGCRWKSLGDARAHWVSVQRNRNAKDRRTAKQILLLIGIGVARAREAGWTKISFNSTPRKVSR